MQKGLIPILIFILITAATGFVVYQNQNRLYQSIQPSTTPSDETVYTEPSRSVYTEPSRSVYTEPSRSVNWKTYTDSSYGYSIKYPNNWYIHNATKTQNASFVLNYQLISELPEIDPQNYRVSLIITNQMIEEVQNRLNNGDATFSNQAQISTTTLHDRKLIKALVTHLQHDPQTGESKEYTEKSFVVLIPLGDKTLQISANLTDRDIVEKMVGSLKF